MNDLSKTPISFEDMLDILSKTQETIKRMRTLAGGSSQPVSVPALLSVLEVEFKAALDKRMDVDVILAANRAVQERLRREIPQPSFRSDPPRNLPHKDDPK